MCHGHVSGAVAGRDAAGGKWEDCRRPRLRRVAGGVFRKKERMKNMNMCYIIRPVHKKPMIWEPDPPTRP